jgi:hypothetical protein
MPGSSSDAVLVAAVCCVRHECHVSGLVMHSPERIRKVRKSMAHIKVVLGERYREMKDKSQNQQYTASTAQEAAAASLSDCPLVHFALCSRT